MKLKQTEIQTALFYAEANEFVAIDIETTGLSPFYDDIIEIALLHYKNGILVDSFSSFCFTEKKLSPFITQLTGISQDDLISAPTIDELLPKIENFISDLPICGHHVEFDASFIEYAFRKRDQNFVDFEENSYKKTYRYLHMNHWDSSILSRMLYPQLLSFSLSSLSQEFKIEQKRAHRAFDDAKSSAEIFIKMIYEIAFRDIEPLRLLVHILEPVTFSMKELLINILNAKVKGYLDDHLKLIPKTTYKTNITGKKNTKESKISNKINEFFKENGLISERFQNYEYRKEQEDLAESIDHAFRHKEFLISEAGTGTGKSLAYLFPTILKSLNNDELIVIATHTKNLQEQLFYKDIPNVQRIINQDFQAVLLKGKTNYLCLDKWHRYTDIENSILTNYERLRISYLVYWLFETDTGDIEENNAFAVEKNTAIWLKFTAENNYCYGRKCPHFDDCYLMKIRNQTRESDIVVINHAMLFSNLLLPNSILGEFNNIVIDEAHNLEKVAADYLGAAINHRMFKRLINKAYSHDKNGLIYNLSHRLASNKSKIDELSFEAINLKLNLLEKNFYIFNEYINQFFSTMANRIDAFFREKQDKFRYQGRHFFRQESDLIANILDLMDEIARDCSDIQQSLELLESNLMPNQLAMQQDFLSLSEDLAEYCIHFQALCEGERENFVFWIEKQWVNVNEVNYELRMAPIDLRNLLFELLHQRLDSAIFTSATLSSQNNFDYFTKRIGLDLIENNRVKTLMLGSPFNLEAQCKAFIVDYLPEPADSQYILMLNHFLNQLIDFRKNGILVLFTNYGMMHQLSKLFQHTAESKQRELLVQGKNGSRSQIIEKMKKNKNSIVFGTDSFWEGIDIPGEALETLIITKLPFAVPDDPLVSARSEQLRKQGLNPFMEYSVPEAIIKFRQGFGRLIRTKNDQGQVFFTDNRLTKKKYGTYFIESLNIHCSILKNSEELQLILK